MAFARPNVRCLIVTNYLHGPLFGHLIDALAPGGVLIYETFTVGNETVGKPSNPAFLLKAGELLDAVRGRLRVIGYEDGCLENSRPALRAANLRGPRTSGIEHFGNTTAGMPRYALPG